MATRITHGDIKNYCKRLREEDESGELRACSNQTLYEAFIDNNNNCILYEKADYIRDRSIYRPSYVTSMTDTPIQTSKNVRKQIDDLPDSQTLYSVLFSIFEEQFNFNINEFEKNNLLVKYSIAFRFNEVDCKEEYAENLGYSWEELEKLGGSRKQDSVPSYVAQAMELFSYQELNGYYLKYWETLFKKLIGFFDPRSEKVIPK